MVIQRSDILHWSLWHGRCYRYCIWVKQRYGGYGGAKASGQQTPWGCCGAWCTLRHYHESLDKIPAVWYTRQKAWWRQTKGDVSCLRPILDYPVTWRFATVKHCNDLNPSGVNVCT
jgi:hypothetical protein